MFTGTKLVLLLTLSLLIPEARSVDVLTDSMDVTCDQTDSLMLACSYRPTRNERILNINARFQNTSVNINTRNNYPAKDSVTAILFLVDTSDPARQNVININAGQIEKMLDVTASHQIYGLASFDKDLNVLVPLGKEKDRLINAVGNLQASGLTTELYRNVIKAIDYLGRENADRKLLVLFSDGQAEDKAYFHEDVINVARRNGVVINSLGYPRSTPLSVALQTLRRLSEETGGVYVESDADFNLPGTFLASPFSNVERGGRFVIDLEPLKDSGQANSGLELRFESPGGIFQINLPVGLPAAEPVLISQPVAVRPPAVMPPAAPAPVSNTDPGYTEMMLWYGLPVTLLILIVLVLITIFMVFRRQKQEHGNGSNVSYAEIKPLAYLITQDEKAKRYPVTSSTWRIGRSLDNEMTIADNSISRRHAEIQREPNGRFYVYDRDSTNGVYVNNSKISRHLLSEGDIIEIGDIFLRFTKNPVDYQFAEDTAMMHTRAPV